MLQALLSDKAKWFLFSFSTPEEIFRAAATWLAIAAVIAFVVCLFVLKGEKRHKLIRVGTVAGVIYACAVGVASLAFWLSDAGKNGEFLAILFVPLAVESDAPDCPRLMHVIPVELAILPAQPR